MTHKCRRSIVAFSISKSVKPNEEEKVLISDLGQGITASTEKTFLGGFGISYKKVKARKVNSAEEQQVAQSF